MSREVDSRGGGEFTRNRETGINLNSRKKKQEESYIGGMCGLGEKKGMLVKGETWRESAIL